MAHPKIDDTDFFRCSGFLFVDNRHQFDDPYDFLDFRERRWTKEGLEWDLTMGVLPVGMILKAKPYEPVVVINAPYGGGQKVVNIKEVLK